MPRAVDELETEEAHQVHADQWQFIVAGGQLSKPFFVAISLETQGTVPLCPPGRAMPTVCSLG